MKYILLGMLVFLASCHKSISNPPVLKVMKSVPVVKLYEPSYQVPDYKYVLKKDGMHRECYMKTMPGRYFIKSMLVFEDQSITYLRPEEVTKEEWDKYNLRAVFK